MNFWKKCIKFITKDVENANETKRSAVMMRMFALIMCGYFLVQGFAMMICGEWVCAGICGFCLIGYAGAFYATYLNKTRIALRYTLCATVAWVIAYIFLYGWDCGAQHFLFVTLIVFFVSSHAAVWKKAILAVVLCSLRYALFVYVSLYEPVIELSLRASLVMQLINTFIIFALITVILAYFCENSLAMEQKLVVYNAKLKEASLRDPLTKLYNRRAMMEYLEKEIETDRKYGGWFNIAIGDIDFFKKINDRYGHEAGDKVLVEVAELLSTYMKSRGKVARWGGEEFLFVFKNINGEEAFLELEKLRSMIERQKILYKDQEISVTMTFGLDEYSSSFPVDDTINNADKKLYMGKQKGRNRVIF